MPEQDPPSVLQRILAAIGRQGSPGSAPRAMYSAQEDPIDGIATDIQAQFHENEAGRLATRAYLTAYAGLEQGLGFATRAIPGVGDALSNQGDRIRQLSQAIPRSALELEGEANYHAGAAELARKESALMRMIRGGGGGALPYGWALAEGVQDARALAGAVAKDPASGLAYIGAQSIEQSANMVPTLAAGAAGGPAAAFAASALMETGALWSEARAAGQTGPLAQLATLAGGTLAAGLDVAGIEGIKAGAAGRALSPLSRAVESAKEIPTEYVQEVIANAASNAGWDSGTPLTSGALMASLSAGGPAIGSYIMGSVQESLQQNALPTPAVSEEQRQAAMELDRQRASLVRTIGAEPIQAVDALVDDFALRAGIAGIDANADDLAGAIASQLGSGLEQSGDLVGYLANRFEQTRTATTELMSAMQPAGDSAATDAVVAEPGVGYAVVGVGSPGTDTFRTYEGTSHGDAIQQALDANEVLFDDEGYLVGANGEEVNTDLFRTNDGRLIDRYQASSEFGAASSEDLVSEPAAAYDSEVDAHALAKRVSSVGLLYGEETVPRGRRTKADVASVLERRTAKALEDAGITPGNIEDPRLQQVMATAIADELVAASKQSGSGAGWYTSTIDGMMKVQALHHPEILTSRPPATAYRVGLAITSQGADVESNLENSDKVYEHFKRTGRFPIVGWGETAQAMKSNFRLANDLLDDIGVDALEQFLSTEFTVGELKAAGYDVSGEKVDEVVYGSGVFGPKIGNGFYQNLSGNFDPITMDMWFTRGMGRLAGKLTTPISKQQRARFLAALTKTGKDGRKIDWMALPPREDSGYDAFTPELIKKDDEALMELAHRVNSWFNRDFGTAKRGVSDENLARYDRGELVKPEAVSAAQRILQSREPKSVPASGGERQLYRSIFRSALEQARAQGVNLVPAEGQAVWWYPEKELYSKLGYRSKRAEPTDYQKVAIARAKKAGYTNEQIDQALGTGFADPQRGGDASAREESGQPVQGEADFSRRDWLNAAVVRAVRRTGRPPHEFRAGDARKSRVAVGGLEVVAEGEYRLRKAVQNQYSKAGLNTPTLFEVGKTRGAEIFHAAISAARGAHPRGAAVTVYDVSDYVGMRLFLTQDGKAGFALKGDDIVSLFSTPKTFKGVAHTLLPLAKQLGGRRLDAFDIGLADLYALHGFTPVGRLAWDDAQADPAWDKTQFAEFNGGEPDVVFMALDPDRLARYTPGEGDYVDYETAVARQQQALDTVQPSGAVFEAPPTYNEYTETTPRREQIKEARAVSYPVRESEDKYTSRAYGAGALRDLEQRTGRPPGDVHPTSPLPLKLTGLGISVALREDGATSLIGTSVPTPADLAPVAQVLRDARFETFYYVLTKGDRIVAVTGVSSRMPGMSYPVPADVLAKQRDARARGGTEAAFSVEQEYVNSLLESAGADGYYIMHNHPSGNPTPSMEDELLTTRFALGDSRMRGHVVIDSGRFATIEVAQTDRGMEATTTVMDLTDEAALRRAGIDPQTMEDSLHTASVQHPMVGMQIGGPYDLAYGLRTVKQSPGMATIIGRDSQGKVRAVFEVSAGAFLDPMQTAAAIAQLQEAAVQSGSRELFLVGGPAEFSSADTAPVMVQNLWASGVIFDVVAENGVSWGPRGRRDLGMTQEQLEGRTVGERVAEPGPMYRDRAAQRIQDADPGEGRPELAIPAQSLAGREAVQAVDTEMGKPTPQTFKEWDDAAADMLQADYEGTRRRLMRDGAESATDVAAARMIVDRETNEALASGDRQKINELVELVSQYRRVRSEQARALVAGRDPTATRAKTMKIGLQEALLNPADATKRKLDKATSNYSRGKILQNEARRIADAQKVLAKNGIDVQKIDYEAFDGPRGDRYDAAAREYFKALRIIGAAKASAGDKAFEYYVNALLSGIRTHNANILGNTVSTAWDMTAQRLAEAMINEIAGKITGEYGDAARLGELPVIMRGAFSRSSMAEAWHNAVLAFDTEQGLFSEEMSRRAQGQELTTKMESSGAAIPGTTGRVIRWPGRFLNAADEFTKTWISNVQAGAEAYRIAKQEGLEGDALDRRMAELTGDRDSEAWTRAYQRSVELTFQEEGGALLKKLQGARGDSRVLQYIFPFVRTPGNLIKIGFRKSPLGLLRVATKGAKHMGYKLSVRADNPELVYTRRQATRDVAEQVLAWGVMWWVLSVVSGQDDADPLITGTKDRQEGAQNLGPLQPTSIKLGDKRYDYSRLEPLGTAMALLVDAANAVKRARREGITPATEQLYNIAVGVARDKSSLQGFGDIVGLVEGFGSPTSSAADYAAKFASGWMPAIIKHAASASDTKLRNYRPSGDGWEWAADLAKATGERSLPIAALAPAVSRDVWGRERTKTVWPAPLTDVAWQMLSPVRVQPEDRVTSYDRALLLANVLNPTEKWYPSLPSPSFERGGRTYQMSREQYSRFLELRGVALQDMMKTTPVPAFVTNPSLRRSTPEAKQKKDLREFQQVLQRAISRAGSVARNQLLGAGMEPTSDATGGRQNPGVDQAGRGAFVGPAGVTQARYAAGG